ncbi:MAG: shikimate kinase [SAR86 cluster bacterium]|uniref:Shikimate kinase n=1 Tax=SAR86 cluster bacterium TaxID=2030880 RepID=A0A2A4X2K1_9GAMM|nr:MAG: shikimate kinase [SAR86 cluster bacterium]
MRKILLFGNSGSGKSTLASRLASATMAHLDLDSLAWLPSQPPQRMPLTDSKVLIDEFTMGNESWVIEGCYTDLLEILAKRATEVVFLNLPVEQCVQNAKARPWEPHKYASKAAQDENLEMLLGWITQYGHRDDVFSLAAHTSFYESFSGTKTCILTNEQSFI